MREAYSVAAKSEVLLLSVAIVTKRIDLLAECPLSRDWEPMGPDPQPDMNPDDSSSAASSLPCSFQTSYSGHHSQDSSTWV